MGKEDEDHYGYLNEASPNDLTDQFRKTRNGDQEAKEDSVAHYYDGRYVSRPDHEYLAWPVGSILPVEEHPGAHEQVELDWPTAVHATTHVYDDVAEH